MNSNSPMNIYLHRRAEDCVQLGEESRACKGLFALTDHLNKSTVAIKCDFYELTRPRLQEVTWDGIKR